MKVFRFLSYVFIGFSLFLFVAENIVAIGTGERIVLSLNEILTLLVGLDQYDTSVMFTPIWGWGLLIGIVFYIISLCKKSL
ncbi:MAG: hypothetical protein MJ250_00060 [Alphaproteobacteria bacterium]|nr:hypothetical protein [Alphaproteobacteria bacterium]